MVSSRLNVFMRTISMDVHCCTKPKRRLILLVPYPRRSLNLNKSPRTENRPRRKEAMGVRIVLQERLMMVGLSIFNGKIGLDVSLFPRLFSFFLLLLCVS